MARIVILRHDEAEQGGEAGKELVGHYDILFERSRPPDRPAITFRIDDFPDFFAIAEFNAERIRDHRVVYLDYEGPVPAPDGMTTATAGEWGTGGRVRRVFAGWCEIHVETPDFLDVTVEKIDQGRENVAPARRGARFVGERVTGTGHDGLGQWRFVRS